jgi:hypothetical protein
MYIFLASTTKNKQKTEYIEEKQVKKEVKEHL